MLSLDKSCTRVDHTQLWIGPDTLTREAREDIRPVVRFLFPASRHIVSAHDRIRMLDLRVRVGPVRRVR